MKLNIENQKRTRIRKANKNVNSYITTIPIDLLRLTDLQENDFIIWDYKLNVDKNKLDVSIEFKKADEIDAPDEVDAEDP